MHVAGRNYDQTLTLSTDAGTVALGRSAAEESGSRPSRGNRGAFLALLAVTASFSAELTIVYFLLYTYMNRSGRRRRFATPRNNAH